MADRDLLIKLRIPAEVADRLQKIAEKSPFRPSMHKIINTALQQWVSGKISK
jgi:predicted transcriptional regulator